MEYFTFLYLSIFNVNLLSSVNSNTSIFCQPLIFSYRFSTLSPAPADDTKRAIPFISGGLESYLPIQRNYSIETFRKEF